MQVEERHNFEGPGSALESRISSSIDDAGLQMQDARRKDGECEMAATRQESGMVRYSVQHGWVHICHRLVIFDMGAFQNRAAWRVVIVALPCAAHLLERAMPLPAPLRACRCLFRGDGQRQGQASSWSRRGEET